MLTIDYNSYRITTLYGKRVRFLVLHYTALDFAASVKALTTSAVSTHYLIPTPYDPSYEAAGFEGQRILNLVAEEDRAWHAGVSGWARRDNLNDTSIGIEIINLARNDDGVFTFPNYERSQINALKQLAKNILQRYPDMVPKNVVGHSDITIGRKPDPGPKLPWKELYEADIGAWYDNAIRDRYRGGFERDGLLPRADLLEALRLYGYTLSATVDDVYFTSLLRTFQMHFRPEDYDGALDVETVAILYALNEKHPA